MLSMENYKQGITIEFNSCGHTLYRETSVTDC